MSQLTTVSRLYHGNVLRFTLTVRPAARSVGFVATVTSAIIIDASNVPRPIEHAFQEHRGTTESEARQHATAEIDDWLRIFDDAQQDAQQSGATPR